MHLGLLSRSYFISLNIFCPHLFLLRNGYQTILSQIEIKTGECFLFSHHNTPYTRPVGGSSVETSVPQFSYLYCDTLFHNLPEIGTCSAKVLNLIVSSERESPSAFSEYCVFMLSMLELRNASRNPKIIWMTTLSNFPPFCILLEQNYQNKTFYYVTLYKTRPLKCTMTL